MPRGAALTQELYADHRGFSLYAAVRCDADEPQRLEQLCYCIARPELANERVQITLSGRWCSNFSRSGPMAPPTW